MRGLEVLAIAGSVLVGAAAGGAVRLLLARLRRGVVLRPGPSEAGLALLNGLGTWLCWGRPTVGLTLLAGLLLVTLSGVDLVHHRLPDAITLGALPTAAVAVVLTAVLVPGSGSLPSAAISAAALWAVFAGMSRISRSWMGRGDVKLIPTLGLLMGYLSPVAVLLGLLIAFVSGSLIALVGLAIRRLHWNSAIPLGPSLLLGCWVVLLFPGAFVGRL
ncbi:leader peptidase (prepilin peptidase)/N-methyltransferase [Nakamurella sp. UYEF19]|uniref:prepilin peptidase n=1 Tax=Nakamurella sp. UYEF19 TaxID=1756392 RepID=UPI0033988BF2